MPTEAILLLHAQRLAAAGDAYARRPCTATADAVIAARLELQEAFIRAGWMPPRYRQEEMQRDRTLVNASAGMFDEPGSVAAAASLLDARFVRRLRRGPVSVELDPSTASVVMRCRAHEFVEEIPLDRDRDHGQLLVAFFDDHQACANGAPYDLDEAVPSRPSGDALLTQGNGSGLGA